MGFEVYFLLFGGCVKRCSPISRDVYIIPTILKRQCPKCTAATLAQHNRVFNAPPFCLILLGLASAGLMRVVGTGVCGWGSQVMGSGEFGKVYGLGEVSKGMRQGQRAIQSVGAESVAEERNWGADGDLIHISTLLLYFVLSPHPRMWVPWLSVLSVLGKY